MRKSDTTERKNETEHGHVTAQMTVYGASGGASISGSFDRSKNSDTTTTVNNSTLLADNIELDTLNDFNLRGGNVHADSDLDLTIGGDLNVESQQNRSRSKNTSMGVSGGVSLGGAQGEQTRGKALNGNAFTNNLQGTGNVGGASGVNGGISASNGMSVTKETVLTSLTSGGTADIKVKGNTQITGALIATVDQEGKDTGKLSFDTKTLNFTDLRNINVNTQTSAGVSANFAVGGTQPDPSQPTTAKGANGNPLKAQSTQVQYENNQQNDASKTLATLGRGNITVGGTQLEKDGALTDAGKTAPSLIALNRDTENTTKVLWNSQQNQTVDASLDHRLLTTEGREGIKSDAKKAYNGIADVFTDLNPALKEQTGNAGSRAYTAARQSGLGDNETNELLSDPRTLQILEQLNAAESALEHGQPAPSTTSGSAEGDTSPEDNNPDEMVVTGIKSQQTGIETATLALNDARVYIDELRQTNPTKAATLEFAIAAATGGVISASIGKGIEYGLTKTGLGEKAAEQITNITDPIKEAAANGIDRYDLSNTEFHNIKLETGETGQEAKLEGGAGFFMSSVLGVAGGLPSKTTGTPTMGIAKNDAEVNVKNDTNEVSTTEESDASINLKTKVVKVDSTNAAKGTAEYEILNNPKAREANTRYDLDNGKSFKTNENGFVEEITFTPENTKVPRDARQTAAGKEGNEGDVGGHAQACSQGGTCDGYNLFPQDANFNNSAYKVFYENKIKAALNDPNQTVGETTIKFVRKDPSSSRPDSLELTYTINGKETKVDFINEAQQVPKVEE